MSGAELRAPRKPPPSILEMCLREKDCLYPNISEEEAEGSQNRTWGEPLLQEVGRHGGKHLRSSHA